jgi:hypothetical protein
LDEAEAFLIVVELNGADVHGSILRLCVSARELEVAQQCGPVLGFVDVWGECLNVRPACQGETARLFGQRSMN